MVDRLLIAVVACLAIIGALAAFQPMLGEIATNLFVGSGLVAVGVYTFFNPGKVKAFMQARQPFQWARDNMDGPLHTVVLWVLSPVAIVVGIQNVWRSVERIMSN